MLIAQSSPDASTRERNSVRQRDAVSGGSIKAGPSRYARLGSRLGAVSLTVAAFMVGGSVASHAADVATFYKGNTVKIIVGFSPGGGYDSYARLMARHIGKHIPGHPTIIVQNMPGSGSLKSVQYLDTRAEEDGTTITAFNPGLISESVTAPDKVNVDFRKYSWLGSTSEAVRICYTWHTRNAKHWQDLLGQKELVFGATTPGTLGFIEANIVKQYLNVPVRLVPGYPGSAEKRLAVEKGELQGDCGGWEDIPEHWRKEHKINVMVRFSKSLLPGMEDSIPYVGDLIKDPVKKKAFQLLISPEEIGRPLLLSKSVPADRLAALRAAFDATVKDPEFLADANKLRLSITPMSGKEVEKSLSDIYDVTPEVAAEARRIASGK